MFAKTAIALFLFFALYVFKRQPKARAAAIVVLVGSTLLPERADDHPTP